MQSIIRTPEERFKNLKDYPFQSHYLVVGEGLRLHYLDEGNEEDPVVLLLHGEPTWSYLYRKMIPTLVQNNFRVIAPDLIGFGKSDKFIEREEYTYQRHIDWISEFILKLDLREINLFCQDWGGLIGLRLVAQLDERFSRIVASNTTLPTGNITMPESFLKWRDFSQSSTSFDIGTVINSGTVKELPEEVIAGYNAPFPSEKYKAGARVFPTLVPIRIDQYESIQNTYAWDKLKEWKKPFLTIFGDHDDIMKGAEKLFQKHIPGAKGQNHAMLRAGHFIQEEKGEELAELIIKFYRRSV